MERITSIKYKTNYYFLLLVAFIIPLKKEFAPAAIFLFFLSCIWNNNFRSGSENVHKKPKSVLFLLLIVLIFIIGVLYGQNKDAGLFNLEIKLSLLAFPISLFITNLDIKQSLPRILKSFTEGVFVACIIGLGMSVTRYFISGDVNNLFYANLSPFAHVSYFSMYLNFAIIILYYSTFKPTKGLHIKLPVTIGLILFFTIIVMLLSSKTGIFSMFFIHLFCVIRLIFKHQKYTKALFLISLVVIGFGGLYLGSSVVKGRVNELFSSITTQNEVDPSSSTEVRLAIWEISFDLIKEKPLLGYGTGDVSDNLMKEYKNRKLEHIANKNLNTHNQYLQTTLSNGIVGLLTLLGMLVIPLFISYRKNLFIYFFFVLLVSFNFATESIIETQSGVVFYAFFNTLFFVFMLQTPFKKNLTSQPPV